MSRGRTGQIAIGDVIGHGVAEQGDVLGHLGDMTAQVEQLVLLDFHVVEQDFALVVVIETWNQVGQR
jgi:hypothetical protein